MKEHAPADKLTYGPLFEKRRNLEIVREWASTIAVSIAVANTGTASDQ